ncbi:hypothetical protein ATANTOWER_023578 [Ataeniobius toweri]|uniref:Uncharacterized protein n=1 Tax=Ataeniobius toweri TaxID=208326 RepID=A0ABU7ALE6_9TELE|nr:hypothetical protein [Ataeniobius toweri]
MCSFLGEFQSKLQSSCNFQPWFQVPALHPAKVKFPSSQGIYLDQVLADSSKPLSSSKRTLLTLHQQLPRISSCNLIHRIRLPRSHLKPSLKKLTTTLDYHRLGSGLTALPDSTSFFIKLSSIHISSPGSSILLLNKLQLFSCLLNVSLHVGQNN